MSWKIYPLDLGTAQLKRSLLLADESDRKDERVASPSTAWLLEQVATQETILVDAGPCEEYEWGVRYHNGFLRNESQNIPAQLASYGFIPEQISMILLTHLHWDHAYGVLEVPDAQVIVQRDEFHYAIDPLPKDAAVYEVSISTQLPFFLHFYQRMKLVSGDLEIRPGINLVTLPGHTPGSQGVLVETLNGPFLIAGDLIGTKENWEKKISGGIVYSAEAYQQSFEKIGHMHAEVLPSHDYRAWEMLGFQPPIEIERESRREFK